MKAPDIVQLPVPVKVNNPVTVTFPESVTPPPLSVHAPSVMVKAPENVVLTTVVKVPVALRLLESVIAVGLTVMFMLFQLIPLVLSVAAPCGWSVDPVVVIVPDE